MPPISKVNDQPTLVETVNYPYARWPFGKFNPVQSRVFEFYNKECNGLIAAATSSGKTVCAEQFLAHEIRVRGGKGMFLGPLKALTQEKIDDWTDSSHHFNDKKIAICTGDYRLTPDRQKEFDAADLIIMTSEMLNHRSRNFKTENNQFLLKVGTLVVDECVPPCALVDTDQGQIPIVDIIDKNLDVKVASFNHVTQKVEYKKIVARQKKILKRKWHTLYYNGGDITVTENHLVWCEGRGYIPSKQVKEGDIIYVRATNIQGKTDSFGNFIGRWVNGSFASWEIGETQGQSICHSENFSRMEIQRVETVGWNSSKSEIKWRLREGSLPIRYIVNQSDVGDTCDLLSSRQKEGNISVVEDDNRSGSFGCLVHGRRKSKPESDVNSHRGVFKNRSGVVVQLDAGEMVGCMQPLSNQAILGTQISCRWQRQISGIDTFRSNSGYGLQGVAKDGDCVLFNVRSGIYCESAGYPCATQGVTLSQQGMSAQMGQDVREDQDVGEEESWCCDLEIEDNNNFFVNGVLVHNSHLLTVPSRGDHLEVGLMKFAKINPKARIVLLSATMPNVEEIGEWISYVLTKRETYVLQSAYRPCPLNVHFEKVYDQAGSYIANEEEKINYALEIIGYYPDDKFLVFSHTIDTGFMMAKALKEAGIDCEFHYSGLQKAERVALENRFRNDPKLRVVVATSTLAWGLNMPARRVIVLGVKRGFDTVESYNIQQMVGRSGRVGLDPVGDAYVLLPEREFDLHRVRLRTPEPIRSHLLDESPGHKYKTLAFHLVSEIHHGDIKSRDDVYDWYERSLAYFQKSTLGKGVVDAVVDDLKKSFAVKEENGELSATAIGTISSMFYFSPFDVSDLRRNFKQLFEANEQGNDLALSVALAAVDSNVTGFANKREKEEMFAFQNQVILKYGNRYSDSVVKTAFAYHSLINGRTTKATASLMRNLKFEYNRLSQVLFSLDTMTGKWNKHGFFRTLQDRVAHGVQSELVDLVQLPGISKVRAKKLYENGIKTLEDVAENPEKVKKALGMKAGKIQEICDEANRLLMFT